MRRISLLTIQKIFVLFVCIWLLILFNNVSNLPVLQRTTTEDESQQPDYSIDISSSSINIINSRRRRQEIILQHIYGNDKRTNSYSKPNINANVNTTAERNMYDSNKYANDNNNSSVTIITPAANFKHIFLGQTTYVDDEEEDENNNDDEDYDDKKTSRNNNKRDRNRNRWPKNKKHDFNNDNDDADYDDFNNDYEESSLRRSPPRRRRNKKEKIRRNIDLLLPMPIIVMGFPKAGTSSIFSFFQRQGLDSQHWYCCQCKFIYHMNYYGS
jgi:hypothetical protein